MKDNMNNNVSNEDNDNRKDNNNNMRRITKARTGNTEIKRSLNKSRLDQKDKIYQFEEENRIRIQETKDHTDISNREPPPKQQSKQTKNTIRIK